VYEIADEFESPNTISPSLPLGKVRLHTHTEVFDNEQGLLIAEPTSQL
jgi:hypothetical protein